MTTSLVLLVAMLALLAWFAKDDVEEYRRFKALKTSRERRRRYAIWVLKQIVYFVVPSLAGLAILGRLGVVVTMPPEFASLAALIPTSGGSQEMGDGVGIGLVIGGMIAGAVFAALLAKRGKKKTVTIGDIGDLLPRNRAEVRLGALLSVSAGLTEELMFRLFLPLLIVSVSGNLWVAFIVPAVIFGLMHRYQGTVGVLATGVVGVVFAGLYLATQSLWIAMLAHVVLDLNGLVLRPILTGALRPAAD